LRASLGYVGYWPAGMLLQQSRSHCNKESR
jgi:hypothetical protein